MNIYNVFRNYKGLTYQQIVDIDPNYVDYVIYSIFNFNLSTELRNLRKYEFCGPVTHRVKLFISKYFDKIAQYKEELKLEKLSFYELEFTESFISFLFYLRKLDPALTGIWFDYLFRYVLDYPNFNDHRMEILEKQIIEEENSDIDEIINETKCSIEIVNENINVLKPPLESKFPPINESENRIFDDNANLSDDDSEERFTLSVDDRLDLTLEEKIKFKKNFLFAFNKNLDKQKLTAIEIFDLSLSHLIFFSNPIKNSPLFRERLKSFDTKFIVELEKFKDIWPSRNTNPSYQYEEYFEGDGDLELDNEIIEFKLINRLPDNLEIFQLLTYASMSKKNIDYISSLQPLSNRIYQWDIRHLSKEERKKWLDRLVTGEFT